MYVMFDFEGTSVVKYKQVIIPFFCILGVQCIFGHFNTGLKYHFNMNVYYFCIFNALNFNKKMLFYYNFVL
jgi:hypothetical protein